MSNRSRYLSAAAAAFLLAWQPSASAHPSARLKRTVLESPLRFEANRGQTDASVKFIARGPGYTMLLAEREAVLNLRGGAVRMRLLDAGATAVAKGLDRLPGATNYLIGNDPSKWRTDVPAFARVQFDQVYPGIDVVYYGSQRKLEYDFVVAPGADPARIRLAFEGARKLSVDSSGDLIMDGPEGEIRQHKPVVYQQIGGARKAVEGRYVIERGHRVAFRLAAYDKRQKLVIDPKLSYSTYYGGNGDDGIFDIAVDSSGYAYVAGVTGSSNLPTTTGALNTTFGPSQATAFLAAAFGDAFVAKFAQDGKTLVYATYLGGNNADGAESIAVDSTGRVAVFGATASTNFPTKNAYRSSLAGWSSLPTDMFVTVLNAAGNALVYSTYFGDTAGQVLLEATFEGGTVIFDSAGNVIIVSQSLQNANVPMKKAIQSTLRGKLNALVAKFDPTQSGDASLVFSTYLGGSDLDTGLSVATDSSNRIYIRGGACSTDFPVTSNAYQPTSKGNCDAFLTELSADGQTMLYSTYLGGSGAEYGTDNEANLGPMPSAVPISWYSSDFGGSFFGAGLAVDSSGYVYVTGATRSTNFPVSTGAYQATNKGSLDAFIVKLDTTKSGAASLIYSTLLGGSGMDRARAVAVDATGVAYVLGETKSTDFPVTSDALQKTNGGGWDLFISAIGPDGKSLSYSTYLGGSNDEQGLYGLKLDGKGGLYIGSASKSSNYPTTAGAYQTSNKGGWDGVLTKLDLDTTPQITLAGIGNAANYVAGKVSPGEIIVVYGYNFGPAALAQLHYTNGVADTSLGNTSIYFDNVAAPMIYAVAGSPGVLSCVVPYAVKTSTQVQVSYNGVKGNTLTVPVVDSVPGIFSLNQSGTGAGAILNWPDYTVNGTSNRVAAGGYIMAYATGEGKTDLAADGQHVPLMGPYPSPLLKPWTATVGGQPAGVTYSGSAPDNIAGVFQVNVQIPTVLTTGVYDLVITTGTFSSTAGLTVAVK